MSFYIAFFQTLLKNLFSCTLYSKIVTAMNKLSHEMQNNFPSAEGKNEVFHMACVGMLHHTQAKCFNW